MQERFTIALPRWTRDFLSSRDWDFSSVDSRMDFVVALSAENARRGTGGPFGAAAFALDGCSLVACGVNRVTAEKEPIAHAEIMAISLASRALSSWDLGPARLELVSSAQPCAMCLGAIVWAGISSLVVGARREDVERLAGFDEGPIPERWKDELERRGVAVTRDVRRIEAAAVLDAYGKSGGVAYNSSVNPLCRR